MKTLIVIEVQDDSEEKREWWQALGLPDPILWNEGTEGILDRGLGDKKTYVRFLVERSVT